MSSGRGNARLLLLLATALLLARAGDEWHHIRRRPVVAATPMDLEHPHLSAAWKLLEEAKPHVRPGDTITVVAAVPSTEMSALMIAMGTFPANRFIPHSYFEQPVSGLEDAAVRIDVGCSRGGEGGRILAWRSPHGCVARLN